MPPKNELPQIRRVSPLTINFQTSPTADAPQGEKSPTLSLRRPSLEGAPDRPPSSSKAPPSPVRADVPRRTTETEPLLEKAEAQPQPALNTKRSVSRLVKKMSEIGIADRYRRGKEIAADPESQEWIEMGKSLRAQGLNQKMKIPMPIAKMVAEMTMSPIPVISNLTHPSEAIRDEILARNDRVAKKVGQDNPVDTGAANLLETTVRPAARREFGYAGESDLNSSGSPPRESLQEPLQEPLQGPPQEPTRELPPTPFQPSHRRGATGSTVTRQNVRDALLACMRGAGSLDEGPYAASLHFSSSSDDEESALLKKPSAQRPSTGLGETGGRGTADKLDAHTTAIEERSFSGITADEIFEHLLGIENIIRAESVSSGQFDGAVYAIDRALAGEEDDSGLRAKLDDLSALFNGKRAGQS